MVKNKKTFILIDHNGVRECFVTKATNDLIYFGSFIPNHENNEATAVMSKGIFKRKIEGYMATVFIDGCTHGKSVQAYTKIICDDKTRDFVLQGV